jgi:hypothetical protein
MHKGTHFNHVIEHVTLEMLALAGISDRSKRPATVMKKMIPKALLKRRLWKQRVI